MKTLNKTMLVCVLVLAFALSFLSAMPTEVQAQPLVQAAEAQAVGGDACGRAWGLGAALGLAALSPCSVVCAALAWYDLALIAAYC
jgi:hypothetical protein